MADETRWMPPTQPKRDIEAEVRDMMKPNRFLPVVPELVITPEALDRLEASIRFSRMVDSVWPTVLLADLAALLAAYRAQESENSQLHSIIAKEVMLHAVTKFELEKAEIENRIAMRALEMASDDTPLAGAMTPDHWMAEARAQEGK